MSLALGIVLLLVGGLSVAAALQVRPGPDADQARGFAVVGATGCFVVGLGVLGIGGFWDGRIADNVAIVALFALFAYYLGAVLINVWPRPRLRRRAPVQPDSPDPAPPDPQVGEL